MYEFLCRTVQGNFGTCKNHRKNDLWFKVVLPKIIDSSPNSYSVIFLFIIVNLLLNNCFIVKSNIKINVLT